jgi:polyphenol oxidase
MHFPAEWITPQWPAPPNVRAVCTTRAGGVSLAPYDSLNLGDHVGDRAEAVAANRALFAEALQSRPVFMNQVHGHRAVVLASESCDAIEADACVATVPGVACTIMVADCLPILFAAADGRAVGAAHAGWRGLAGEGGQGVVEAACAALQHCTGADPTGAFVWLGPCIGPDAFEVGSEVKAAFEMQDMAAATLFKPLGHGKWLADLAGLARRRLQALGITRIYGNDGSRRWCTVANPSQLFSHRRDRVSGRFAASIWLA